MTEQKHESGEIVSVSVYMVARDDNWPYYVYTHRRGVGGTCYAKFELFHDAVDYASRCMAAIKSHPSVEAYTVGSPDLEVWPTGGENA